MRGERLQVELAAELACMDAWLVVREHPFNTIHQRCLDVRGLANVFVDEGNLDDLLAQADGFLFTLSTLQFEIALRGKPVGLLARSPLSGAGEAPFRINLCSRADFLRSFTTATGGRPRQQALLRKVCCLYEHQLLDLAPEHGRLPAQDLAGLLAGCTGGPLTEAIAGLQAFLYASGTGAD